MQQPSDTGGGNEPHVEKVVFLTAQSSAKSPNYAISQKKMTTQLDKTTGEFCPAEQFLKQLSGKWKPQIFKLALDGPLRFNALLRQLPGSSKQAVATALRDMEDADLLTKHLVREKPLHIEYTLSARGAAMVEVFRTLEKV